MMPRPRCRRRVAFTPDCQFFKPAGVPLRELEEVVLSADELEALRLADAEGLYQEQAADRMSISRPTFSRTVEAARRKVAVALTSGKAIRIGELMPTAPGEQLAPMCGRGGKRKWCQESEGIKK